MTEMYAGHTKCTARVNAGFCKTVVRSLLTADLSNNWIRILNEKGKLEVLQENNLREWLNEKDFH